MPLLPQAVDVVGNSVVLAALWVAYSTVRSLTAATEAAAIENAERLLAFQNRIGVTVESELQTLVDTPSVLVAANSYYLVHFPITVAVLIAAFLRDRSGVFVTLRNSLVAVTGVALVVHVMVPLAPPRMLPGFLDASSVYGPDPYSLPGSESANQFAAMPSMHVAWAVLVSYTIWRLYRMSAVRVLAVVHPAITAFVVLVTAHHFASDVFIGGLLAAAALSAGAYARRQPLITDDQVWRGAGPEISAITPRWW